MTYNTLGLNSVYIPNVGNIPLFKFPKNDKLVVSLELIHLEILSGSRQESGLVLFSPWEEQAVNSEQSRTLDDFYIELLKTGFNNFDLTQPHRLTVYRSCEHELVDHLITAAYFEFPGI